LERLQDPDLVQTLHEKAEFGGLARFESKVEGPDLLTVAGNDDGVTNPDG